MASTKIFGTTIHDACLKVNLMVPQILVDCVNIIDRYLDVEGLFRVPGPQTEIEHSQERYDRGFTIELDGVEVHHVCGLLKLYLRLLKEPLIPPKYYDDFIGLSIDEDGPQDEYIESISNLVNSLPLPNISTMAYLLQFLIRVSDHSSKNKMDPKNIATVFGPTVLRRSEEEDSVSLSEMSAANKIINFLLDRYDDIFTKEQGIIWKHSLLDPEEEKLRKRFVMTEAENSEITPIIIENLDPKQHSTVWTHFILRRMNLFNERTRKLEEKILIIGEYRFFVFARGGRLEHSWHFLDLKEIISLERTSLIIVFSEDQTTLTFNPVSYGSFDIDALLEWIYIKYEQSFIGKPDDQKHQLHIGPEKRKERILAKLHIGDPADSCGGMVSTYKSVSDWMGYKPKSSISWHLYNILYHNNVKELNIVELVRETNYPNESFESLIYSLSFNTWFDTLIIDNVDIGNEGFFMIAEMMKYNSTIHTLQLSYTNASKKGVIALAEAFQENPLISITDLNLSGNAIDDTAMTLLSKSIQFSLTGLTNLNFTDCQFGKRGAALLFNALKSNQSFNGSIQSLKLSNARIDQQANEYLFAFISSTTVLSELLLPGSPPYAYLPIYNGSSIRKVDFSKTKLSSKSTELAGFFIGLDNLEELNVSKTGLYVEALINIFSSNPLISLDISDNTYRDEDIIELFNYCSENLNQLTSLKLLNISRIFSHRRTNRETAVESVSRFIESSYINDLKIAGGGKGTMRADIVPIAWSLMKNRTITHFDISDNEGGDDVAVCIMKVLQRNKYLHNLSWDGNNISYDGYLSFNIGLQRNSTLTNMPTPIKDITNLNRPTDAGYTHQQFSIHSLMDKIQRKINENAIETNKDKQVGKRKKNSRKKIKVASPRRTHSFSPKLKRRRQRSHSKPANVRKRDNKISESEENEHSNIDTDASESERSELDRLDNLADALEVTYENLPVFSENETETETETETE
eukprot:TRINITY_DN1920_c0_g1_i1.p1 TRINITY_DN1920_c0_g1~~TRINITY_DN1920_c0_g1_i1.p1  ORF type:complete len:1114 (-),score=239.65 TRINITY_DN1920_c0_g1_i1:62-2983(-)